MHLLPVIGRELQMRARHPATYWSRCGIAGLTCLAAVFELTAAWGGTGPGQAGLAVFNTLQTIGMLLACGATVVTADCLSSERREGTLGLLLLTKLRERDVILGKMVAAGLTSFYGLTCLIPAFALIVLAGGVTGGLVARCGLALLSSLFLALSVGMYVSARSQNRANALRAALLLMLSLGVLPRIALNVGYFFTPKAWVLASFSPITAFYLAPDARYQGAKSHFWTCILLLLASGGGLIWAAARRLGASWQTNEKIVTRHAPVIEPVMVEEARAMAESRHALLQTDPICWSVSRLRIQSLLLWAGTLLLLLGGTGVSWSSLLHGSVSGLGSFGVMSSLYLLVVLTAGSLLAWAAGRFLYEAKRSGELELLLSTPLGARDIIGGNWRALSQPLRGAWLLVAFLVLFQLVLNSDHGLAFDSFQRALVPINRSLDAVALCWVGMWFGLTVRRPFLILAWSVGLVIGIPWLLSCFLVVGVAMSPNSMAQASPAHLLFWFGIWPVLELGKNLCFILWASGKLRAQLRTQASLASGRLLA